MAEALGAHRQLVHVELRNLGARTVDLHGLRFAFVAERAGVRFPCSARPEPAPAAREARLLAKGSSLRFARLVDCATPLPGRYSVSMRLLLPSWIREDEAGDVLGSFDLEVVAHGPAPVPYPGREGLFVLITGEGVSHPLPAESWARGRYRMLVAVVNASTEPLRVGGATVSIQTYRHGTNLPCGGQMQALAFPGELAAGATALQWATVSCAPSQEGRYELVGRFRLGELPEIEAGRVPLTVSKDPMLFSPLPVPPWEEQPFQRRPE